MATTEEQRLAMYKALEEVIGLPNATVLMDSLPPGGWGEYLDVRFELLERRLDTRFAESETRIERSLRDMQRNLFFGFLGSQVALAGLLVTLLR